ncbi:sugar glycosyltransferase [Phytobacter sp. V91]|uniref:sugar glycosyltransferase n=1 Tax=Phytobacter sp. V91 TaxID=3369425 RepID=UPI003F626F4F
MGSLFKQIYRYTRPKSYRHNENLWPWTKITRATSGEICGLNYKGSAVPLVDLSALKGSAQGEVMLTATGPSTAEIDFKKLPGTLPVMGVNGAYSLAQDVAFTLYLIVDMEFFDKRSDLVESIIADPGILLFTTMHGIAKILDRHATRLKCRLALIEDACYKIYQPKVADEMKWQTWQHRESIRFCADRQDIGFSTDIREGIFDAGTVVYWALQILCFMGFETILISGLDMNNFQQPRFYETAENKLPSYLENKVDNLVIPSFAHAAKIMKENKSSVLNFSLNSAVPDAVFTKVFFDDYFKNR